jgi:predicted ATPase
MKIDIHTHTIKIKQGDSENRNIDVDKFSEIIKETDVKILAITNHNFFNAEQYIQFKKSVEDICQIWPGVEFDILEESRKAHLIVIVNPKNYLEFNQVLNGIVENQNLNNFTISIDEVVSNFDKLDCIYIAHYHSKKPDLTDKDIDKLLGLVSNKKRILKEASNSISAGIYINHGHNSIHGSDVQNWDEYINNSKYLPELRLPVESFEQFCLLLNKDSSTIKTILDKKTKEIIEIRPFGNSEIVNLDIYNDINIIFGSKGTGKTEILKSISNYYNSKGFKTDVYESNLKRLDEIYDTRGTNLSIDVENVGLDSCSNDFSDLLNATEKNITSLSSYLRYFSTEATNKISKKIKIDKFTQLDENSSKRNLKEIRKNLKNILEWKTKINSDIKLKEIIGEDLTSEFNVLMSKIIDKINLKQDNELIESKSLFLFNNIIKLFVSEISKKTGLPEKPIKTGFYEYASNRISIEIKIKKIIDNINKKIDPKITYVGDLGEKGKLYYQTNLIIQNGNIVDSKYTPIQNVNKLPQRSFAQIIFTISNHVYSNTLFEKITALKNIDGIKSIKSLNDLLLFYRHFTLNGQIYSPSNGESSMVLLYNELTKDKEIFLIDEPEKSLGNDYISDVIVPLIKASAKSGKKIIIATHDANIAVRTLPYNSIYRFHDNNGYYTYSGNPFSNTLKCNDDKKEDLDWKIISMKTLEGGETAFGERSKIYGNT